MQHVESIPAHYLRVPLRAALDIVHGRSSSAFVHDLCRVEKAFQLLLLVSHADDISTQDPHMAFLRSCHLDLDSAVAAIRKLFKEKKCNSATVKTVLER